MENEIEESEETAEEQEITQFVEYADDKKETVYVSCIKPKYYKQTYRTAWEDMPEFKGWLKGVPGQSQRAYCTYCQKSLHAHRLSLLKHTCTIRHQKAAQLNYIRQQQKENLQGSHEGQLITDDMETVNIIIPSTSNGEEEDESNPLEAEDEHLEEEEEYQVMSEEELSVHEIPAHVRRQMRQDAQVMAVAGKPPISTHVLDTSRGAPVAGLQVSLYKLIDGRWTYMNEVTTNPDGRCNAFVARENFTAGRYKLHYDVDRYFELRKQESLYPFIEIVFDCRATVDHYHIPLLLTPFGYTTYRGT